MSADKAVPAVRVLARIGTQMIFIRILFLFWMVTQTLACHALEEWHDDADTSSKVIELNNEAVAAQNKLYRWKNHRIIGLTANLKDSDYEAIIHKFAEPVKLDPLYRTARSNLAIAHNNFALFLASHDHNNEQALREFHRALYVDADNVTTVENLNELLRNRFRLNPKIFRNRTALGDQARTNNDLVGAVVEYRAALKLRDDATIHKKLADVYKLLDEKDKAVAEYAAAYREQK